GLTETVPIERLNSELGRYIQAGATKYLLVNTSDLRPVVMTTKAVMDVGWKGVDSTGRKFYSAWSADQFGEKAAPTVAQLYQAYFEAPADMPFGDRHHKYDDRYYHWLASQLILANMAGQRPFYVMFSTVPPTPWPAVWGPWSIFYKK